MIYEVGYSINQDVAQKINIGDVLKQGDKQITIARLTKWTDGVIGKETIYEVDAYDTDNNSITLKIKPKHTKWKKKKACGTDRYTYKEGESLIVSYWCGEMQDTFSFSWYEKENETWRDVIIDLPTDILTLPERLEVVNNFIEKFNKVKNKNVEPLII